MSLLSVSAGVVLVLLALREMFHQFFHPGGQGSLSDWTMRAVFTLFRARPLRSRLYLAGAVGVASSLVLWALLLIVGWALIYAPYLPDEFLFSDGLPAEKQEGFVTALYLSVVTLGTLGYGDITPTSSLLRLVAPIESLMGFALLTAGLTWVVSLYPAIARQRCFAHHVQLLVERDMASAASLSRLGEAAAISLLTRLEEQVVASRTELNLFSALRHFHTDDRRASLPGIVPKVASIAREGKDPRLPEAVRMHADLLEAALQDLAVTVSESILRDPHLEPAEAFGAFARQHEQPAR